MSLFGRSAATIVSCLMLSLAGWCHADTISLTVDQSQSTVTFEILGSVETSSVTGTGTIEINPGSEPFETAQVTELNLTIADGFEFNLFFGAVTITSDPNDAMVNLDVPGPAGMVNASNQFDQLMNLVSLVGLVELDDPFGFAGGSAVFDLADAGQTPFDALGAQLSVSGDTLSVQLPINLSIDATPDFSVVATASVVLNGELVPFLLGDINCDGEVNLLDVNPFIGLLTTDPFNAKGDLNQDGEINLLDVDPFVKLLSGG